MRYFIRLSYDGTNFAGWQRQPNGISVQEVLEDKLSMLLREEISVTGCGRTDAGVHAWDYYAHFDAEQPLPENLVYKLNSTVGPEIAVRDIYWAAADSHARYSAKKRTYKYFIHYRKDPFKEAYSFYMHDWPDVVRLNRMSKYLIGEFDFTSFEKKGSDNKNSDCIVYDAHWELNDNKLVFTITANRFLRNMVRAITGTLISIAMDKMNEDEVWAAFNRQEQLNIKIAVPAKGLFLWNIEY